MAPEGAAAKPDPYAITAADLNGGLRRVLGGGMGQAGCAMGRVLADLFRAKGYRIAAGCGTGGSEDDPEELAGAWLVCERDGRRKAVMCRLYPEGGKAGREDVTKLAKTGPGGGRLLRPAGV